MTDYGKPIKGTDDSSKEFQQKCLDGTEGKGIDIEGVYYAKKMDTKGNVYKPDFYQYYIFEYLRCEAGFESRANPFSYPSTAPSDLLKRDKCPYHFSPWNSDPNKYKINWRKFYVLYKLSLKLQPCQLVLINYSNGFIRGRTGSQKAPSGHDEQVRLMYVDSIDEKVLEKIRTANLNELKDIKDDYIIIKEDAFYTFSEYQQWFKKLNANCILPSLR